MKPVIICGGVGSKMWPASRQKSPKHFLPLINGKSLFQVNWELLRQKYAAEEIYLQTNVVQAEIAKTQVPEIVEDNIFIEPEMRNQGPATGFAAAMLFKKFPDEPFIMIQADVLREPGEKFLEMVEMFDQMIRQEGRLMTAGLKPDYAVMGVDYLKVDKETHRMEEWLGRGEKELIEGYLTEGQALIHTNHYAWTPRKMLECFKIRKPEWYTPLMNIVNGGDIASEYAKMPKGPIEEVAQFELLEGLVMELPFNWIDFGTWESVSKYLEEKSKIDNLNSKESQNEIKIDAEGNFTRMPQGKMIAMVGVSDLVVVDTGDALLICHKSQTGRVGEVVEKLKAENRNELL